MSLTKPVLGSMYGAFLWIGLVMGMTGQLIPGLSRDLGLTYGQAGLLFSAQSLGSLPVLLAGGWLVHQFGKRRLLTLGAAAFALGLGTTALAPGFAWVLGGNVALGAGMSLLDIGISTLCLDAAREGKGRALNLLHGFFGAGAVVGPLFALALGGVEGGWRWAFGLAALGPLALALVVPFVTMPEAPEAAPAQ